MKNLRNIAFAAAILLSGTAKINAYELSEEAVQKFAGAYFIGAAATVVALNFNKIVNGVEHVYNKAKKNKALVAAAALIPAAYMYGTNKAAVDAVVGQALTDGSEILMDVMRDSEIAIRIGIKAANKGLVQVANYHDHVVVPYIKNHTMEIIGGTLGFYATIAFYYAHELDRYEQQLGYARY